MVSSTRKSIAAHACVGAGGVMVHRRGSGGLRAQICLLERERARADEDESGGERHVEERRDAPRREEHGGGEARDGERATRLGRAHSGRRPSPPLTAAAGRVVDEPGVGGDAHRRRGVAARRAAWRELGVAVSG